VIHRSLLRLSGALLGSLLLGAGTVLYSAALAASTAPAAVGAAAPVDRSPAWASLTPTQQQALGPLRQDWSGIDGNRKQKWLAIAARFPKLPADERKRVQERMTEWTHLTPAERNSARLQFNEARQVSPEERQAKWQAYQALPEAERQQLAQRAKPAVKANPSAALAGAPVVSPSAPAPSTTGGGVTNSPRRAATVVATNPADGATKRNLVRASAADQVKPVAPLVVQAQPGATTNNMSTRPPRPSHSQPGTPKIAATPGYVDPATLLPKRGAQGAAAVGTSDDIPSQ
jgi:Protein of unknown function (DUF3106)